MRTIKLTISYDGTLYKGWQSQKNGKTIQDEIEKAIEKVLAKKHVLYSASRTDAGVHAKKQVAHFKTSSAISLVKIPLALNTALPDDIAITKAELVPDSFHARFDAKIKHYCYHVYNSHNRDPFKEKYSWRVPYKLNVALMKKEALVLAGEHDFKSFQAKDKIERPSVRKIHKIIVRKNKSDIFINIEGNGFLYNMVRSIAGTLVDIGRGYLPQGSMKDILKSKDRTKAGPTAPAKGLFLIEVKY
ncbi:MAG: tRNA pseudouridine(38-40) synthase TruA [Candidatus Omnitrophica bacterium]|nr:tRNA pseudouridine(38-40) synthase TruA [Candidatus Omnitrophota bacterium]